LSVRLVIVCLPPDQFEAKKRVSAENALRVPYFKSLGEQVQTLQDSEYTVWTRNLMHAHTHTHTDADVWTCVHTV